ncbi:MAG: hypothetical protein GX459_03345 [Bacteroidales bacterium]|nr:hypothetical protein [Bacteroidales bacterium]
MHRNFFSVLVVLSSLIITFSACKNRQGENASNETTVTSPGERKPPEFKYDDRGNIIQRKDFTYDMQGVVKSKNQYDYKYDDRGNRIEEITQSWDLTGKRIIYTIARFKYNEFNLKAESSFVSYDPDGHEVVNVRNVYTYDKNGYEIKDEQFDKDGKRLTTVTRKRDEKGRILEETATSYNPDGTIKETKGAQYDINGRILKTW